MWRIIPQHLPGWLEQLKCHPVDGETTIVFGMARTKNLKQGLLALQNAADSWIVSPLKWRESYSPAQIQQELEALGVKNCYTSDCLAEGLKCALLRAEQNDRIVVCGSFLAVAEAKLFLGDRNL